MQNFMYILMLCTLCIHNLCHICDIAVLYSLTLKEILILYVQQWTKNPKRSLFEIVYIYCWIACNWDSNSIYFNRICTWFNQFFCYFFQNPWWPSNLGPENPWVPGPPFNLGADMEAKVSTFIARILVTYISSKWSFTNYVYKKVGSPKMSTFIR